jgi:hypothetical protein
MIFFGKSASTFPDHAPILIKPKLLDKAWSSSGWMMAGDGLPD